MKSLNITAGALDHPVVVMDVGEVGNPDVIRVCGVSVIKDTSIVRFTILIHLIANDVSRYKCGEEMASGSPSLPRIPTDLAQRHMLFKLANTSAEGECGFETTWLRQHEE